MASPFDGVTLDTNLTDRQRLEELRTRLEELLRDRIGTLSEEASMIASDLEALGIRLLDQGHRANIEDIRSARWYKTKHELLIVRGIYGFVCRLMQVSEGVIAPPGDEFAADPHTIGGLDG